MAFGPEGAVLSAQVEGLGLRNREANPFSGVLEIGVVGTGQLG